MAVWVVRAGKRGQQEKFALENDVVVVDWPELRDLKGLPDKVALESLYRETYPGKTSNMITPHITQLWNLTKVIKYDDIIILPLKKPNPRVIAFGRAIGTYTYRANFPKEALHTVPVK
jgi:restriction system protein